jgi:hypothetical protein
MADQPCPCPTICFRVDLHLYLHPCPAPPSGIKAGLLKQVKGKHMSADVLYTYTPDPDTNVNQTATTFLVNGTAVGTVNQPSPAPGTVNYSNITPAPPALNVGDVVTTTTITTDSFSQSSPAIASANSVTIAAIPSPPLGITPGTLKQLGSP